MSRGIRLRYGLHTGDLDPSIRDHHDLVKGNGDAIIVATRVMDFGDDGHILMSEPFVDGLRADLAQLDDYILPLGVAQDKHGFPIQVYNYFDGSIGNLSRPRKLGGRPTTRQTHIATPMKVAIAYKRNSENDEHVMAVLREGLEAAGHQVFIDLNVLAGMPWANEIRRKIWEADILIVLLSARSVGSEMVEEEVLEASRAQEQQKTHPRCIPVRIDFREPLPAPFATILEGLQQANWTGPHDDQPLVEEVLHAIAAPGPKLVDLELEPVGGAMPLDSKFYIERETDASFIRAVERREALVLIKGPRQVGKTSLLSRALQRARDDGERVVLTDFQALNEGDFADITSFYKGLCALMLRRMGQRVPSSEFWAGSGNPNADFEDFVAAYAVPERGYLIWGLDEVDRLFGQPYASQVFALFRAWYNVRATDPSQPYARIVMPIAYATEAHLFITDLNQSPFNVGTRLKLEDFTPEQVSELNERYGRVLESPSKVMLLFDLVAGQPFLIRRALHELAEREVSLTEFVAHADRDEGPFGDHLRRILMGLARSPALADTCRQVLRRTPCTDIDAFLRLRSAGVLRGDSTSEAQFRCRLYQTFLDRHLR